MQINALDTTGKWAVNGTPIYVPSRKIKVEHTNVAGSSSGRTEDGRMHIDWIRRDVRKVYLAYSAMTENELNYIMELMLGKEFTFSFVDCGQAVTMEAYASNAKYTLYMDSDRTIYTEVEINVTEI